MILEITWTDGKKVKICNVVCAGKLGTHPEELYYMQLNKRKGKATSHEIFIPFEKIEQFLLR